MAELRLVANNPAPSRRRTPVAHVTEFGNIAIIDRWIVSGYQLVEKMDGVAIRLKQIGRGGDVDLYLCSDWSVAEGALAALRHEHARSVLPPLRLPV